MSRAISQVTGTTKALRHQIWLNMDLAYKVAGSSMSS